MASDPTDAVTAPLESAGFVHVVTGPDGDRLAAAGMLGRALSAVGIPFQVSVGRTNTQRQERLATATEDAVGLAVGTAETDAVVLEPTDGSATLGAVSLSTALGVEPDPALVLAGATAAGHDPNAAHLAGHREAAGTDQEPGVGVPTTDPVDGLAHLGCCLAPWSGDPEATREALEPIPEDPRELASLVALAVVSAPTAGPAAADAVTRVCGTHRLPDGPVATAEGYADVLEALARAAPGTGVGLALGHDVGESALTAWREHGQRLHAGIAEATERRRGDVLGVALPAETPADAAARVLAAHRAPVVVAVTPGVVGLAARDGRTDAVLEALVEALGGESDLAPSGLTARLETDASLEAAMDATVEVSA